MSEALATAAKIGVDVETLAAVLASGGGNSRMLEMMIPWVLRGDDSLLQGPLRIAAKDIRYYTRLAEAAPMAAFIAQAVNQTYTLALANGHADRFLPTLPGVLARLNGGTLRDEL